jgi:hypothetical protein
LECARDEGVDALRAIKLDVSADRRTRRNLAMRIFAYERLATAPEVLIKFWMSVTRFMSADKLICDKNFRSVFEPVLTAS